MTSSFTGPKDKVEKLKKALSDGLTDEERRIDIMLKDKEETSKTEEEPISDDATSLAEDAETGGQGLVMVNKMYKEGDIIVNREEKEEKIEVGQFITRAATIGYKCGMTINLGDYSSSTVAVFISLPCYLEELEDAYGAARKFAESRLTREVQAIREWKKKRQEGSAGV